MKFADKLLQFHRFPPQCQCSKFQRRYQDFGQILVYVEGYELLVIDEAQGIPDIGTALKIIVDQVPEHRCIATGSSSFELTGQIDELLTGFVDVIVSTRASTAESLVI